MKKSTHWGLLSLALLGAACTKPVPEPVEPAPEPAPEPASAPESATPKYPTQVFFGDTHVHTGFSFDAGLFGATTDPNDAFDFAKGEEVTASKGLKAKLQKPLDFLVVADHAENLGFFKALSEGSPKVVANPKGKEWYEGFQKGGQAAVEATLDLIKTYSQGKFPKELQLSSEETKPLWHEMIDAAEKHNDPGKFTAFIGYEWTSMPGSLNLHRVVILRDGAKRAKQGVPFSAQDSDDPEKLWEAMAGYEEKTGGRILAIPHNGNLSNGQMFVAETQDGRPFDEAYAKKRIRYEPLYEVTQIKGDGETHSFLSPDDEFADFETWDVGNLDVSAKKTKEMIKTEYARQALRDGLAHEAKLGTNPFKFGMIGSTDSHTGLATADSDNFFGKHSGVEPNAERASGDHKVISGKGGTIYGWQMAASGYAAVWAKENTREALFDAMERKETYATTGPRMTVRLFGGWDFTDKDLSGDLVEAGYSRGVPMGGDLAASGAAKAPSFLIAAMKEADGANLDRVQIVKGWLDADGQTHEKVYDVSWSDDRKVDQKGKVPGLASSVDTKECSYTNDTGAAELKSVWTDPQFDPAQSAFYYVRVIEIATPRWTCFDVKRYGTKLAKGVPLDVQERAYTSPIWYTPQK